MRLAGAKLVFTSLDKVSLVMDNEMDILRQEGYSPYYIYGGGHGLPGAMAYYDAARSYLQHNKDFNPDYVIHASGTGGTQAGLVVGFNKFSPTTKVIGISIARDSVRGRQVIQQSCNELTASLNIESVATDKVIFLDEWHGGGYGKTYPELFLTIKKFASEYGLITDPTYTGKALHALTKLIDSGYIPGKSKVLFWHTGGQINLLDYTKEFIQ